MHLKDQRNRKKQETKNNLNDQFIVCYRDDILAHQHPVKEQCYNGNVNCDVYSQAAIQ